MSAKAERANMMAKKRTQKLRKRKRCNSETDLDHLQGDFQTSANLNENENNELNNDSEVCSFFEKNSEERLDSNEDLTNRFSSCDSDSDSSDSDCGGDNNCPDTLIDISFLILELRKWAFKCKITRSSVDLLLKILKPYHPQLPLSAKTLLKSPPYLSRLIKKFNPSDETDDSQYVYFGIYKNLERIVNVFL